MQIENETPYDAMALPNFDKDGREAVTIVVKGTFSLVSNGVPEPLGPEDRLPIVMADEYWGKPGESPMKYEADLAHYKPFADLVLLGHAYDPKGRATKSQRVEFAVGKWSKKATVSSSEAMERIPLYFLERMRGGPKLVRAKRPKNGFGFYPKQCKPRLTYAGKYDDKWRKERFPFLPADFDYRFFQVAFPGLICDSYLQGGEEIHATGVTPDGRLDSVLPSVRVEVEAFLEDREEKAQVNLDTLVVIPDHSQLALTWRSFITINGAPSTVRGFQIREASGASGLQAGR